MNEIIRIRKEIDALQHNKETGFYDASVDMYFRDLAEWLSFSYPNKSFGEIYC